MEGTSSSSSVVRDRYFFGPSGLECSELLPCGVTVQVYAVTPLCWARSELDAWGSALPWPWCISTLFNWLEQD